ncbi:MAG: monovalent cation/hydrogen antiporter [Thermoleophilaceae bacterium]|nr:monovalent cation/hydrogen antiporter [Thermoleophilaceae bacterium]
MEHIELIVFGLLLAIAGLAVLAGLLRVPYPVTLVAGGAVIGFLPGVPDVTLNPDVVLLIFLPPLLYGAAFFTSVRDLGRNAKPIALLAIPLVLVTMCAVAFVAHHVVGLDWGPAFVFGAIVSPTDAVAPAEIMRRIGAPRRLITIIEGENLTNDWTALILYRFAVAAVVSGSFSLWHTIPEFVATGVGGVLVGLLAGRVIREVRSRIDDPPTEITISILSGYVGYLPAEELGLSGVLAAVTTGLYMGWHTPQLTTPLMRLQGVAIWEILTFLLNAVLFLLVGLQLPGVLDGLSGTGTAELILWALLVSAVVVGVRLMWMFLVPLVVRMADRRANEAAPRRAPPGERLAVGWAGMRGSVSLAAALAIPLQTDAGADFPARELIIFLTFAVILVTLVGQGLTLAPLIARLRLMDDGLEEREERIARRRLAEAGLSRIDELGEPDWISPDSVGRARNALDYRRRRFDALVDGDGDGFEERTDAWRRLMYDLFDAQREALVAMRNRGEISDEVRRKIERDLDLEESRLEN